MLQKYYKHRNIYNLALIVLVGGLVFPVPAHALFGTGEETVYWFVVTVFGFFVQLAGYLLDFGFQEFVIGMGGQIIGGASGTGIGIAVDTLWTVVRDLFNIVFILGLIWIGFQTILGVGGDSYKKSLVTLIAAALLINFSLFGAKLVVDIANLTATQVYTQITKEARKLSPNTLHGIQFEGITGGVSSVFMSQLNLQTLFSAESLAAIERKKQKKNLTDEQEAALGSFKYTYIIGMMVIFIVATVAFAAGGFMLIARFVAIILLLILSPIIFLGWVIPKFQSLSNQYMSMLLRYAFFAPAYAFMLYMSLKVLEIMRQTMGFENANNYADALLSGKETDMAVIMFFLVAIGFMIASVVVGQQMGIAGSGFFMGVMKNVGNRGRAMVNGVGRAGYFAARYPDRAIRRWGVGAASSKLNAGFDKWQAKEGQTAAGRLARGFLKVTDFDKNIKDTLTAGQNVKAGLGRSYQEISDYQGERERRLSQTKLSGERSVAADEALKKLADNSASETELTSALETLDKTLKAMTVDEHIKLGDKLKSQAVATSLRDSDIEALEKSGKVSAGDIADIKSARKIGFQNIASNGAVSTKNQTSFGTGYSGPAAAVASTRYQRDARAAFMRTKSVSEIGKLPIEIFTNPNIIPLLTPKMVEERIRNGGIDLSVLKRALDPVLTAMPPGKLRDSWKDWSDNNGWGRHLGLSL